RGAGARRRGHGTDAALQGDNAGRAGAEDQRLRPVERAGERDVPSGGGNAAVGGVGGEAGGQRGRATNQDGGAGGGEVAGQGSGPRVVLRPTGPDCGEVK